MNVNDKTEAIIELQKRLTHLNSDFLVLEEIKSMTEVAPIVALSGKTMLKNAKTIIQSVIEEQETIHQEIILILDESFGCCEDEEVTFLKHQNVGPTTLEVDNAYTC